MVTPNSNLQLDTCLLVDVLYRYTYPVRVKLDPCHAIDTVALPVPDFVELPDEYDVDPNLTYPPFVPSFHPAFDESVIIIGIKPSDSPIRVLLSPIFQDGFTVTVALFHPILTLLEIAAVDDVPGPYRLM